MKLKKALSSLLALVLLLSCMSITALADGDPITVTPTMTEWSTAGTYVVNDDVTINGTVTISADVTLNIAAGKTLTIKGTNGNDCYNSNADDGKPGIIIQDSGCLTVGGSGTLDITGGDGGNVTADYYYYTAGNGAEGIESNANNTEMIVNGGTVTVTGGSGGDASTNGSEDFPVPGVGACGISDKTSVIVNGGMLNVSNGAGGRNPQYVESAGSFAIGGSLTVKGGSVTITDVDPDGNKSKPFHSNASLTISKGNVTIHGIMSCTTVMSGGFLTIDGDWNIGANTAISGGFISVDENCKIINYQELVDFDNWTFESSPCITGGYFNRNVTFDGSDESSALIDATSYKCVDNADPATKDIYGYIVLPIDYYQLISASSLSGQGGVNFMDSTSQIVTSAKAGTNVTATAVAVPLYDAALSSTDVTIDGSTGDSFTMPAKTVTVTAVYSEIATTGEDINLDLEESDTYPDHKDIDQYYTKTETSSVDYKNRFGVTWWTDAKETTGDSNLVIQVNKAVKWDPTTLSWVTDDALNGVASVQEGTDKVNFQLSNYSAKAFTCSITYAANTEDTYANKAANTVEFDSNNGGTIAKVENDINKPGETNSAYLDENGQVDLTKVPTLTITGTVGVDLDGFKNANANSTAVKYGRFTVTCTAVTE